MNCGRDVANKTPGTVCVDGQTVRQAQRLVPSSVMMTVTATTQEQPAMGGSECQVPVPC